MIKLTIVLLIGLAVVAALRMSSAALRHWVLTVSIVCAAMMPGLQRVVPRWELPFHGPPRKRRRAEIKRIGLRAWRG